MCLEQRVKITSPSVIFFTQFFVSSKPSTTCCDSISRSVPDGSSAPQAAAAASFCCPPACDKRLVSGARAELSAALGVYGSPYAPAHAYANYFQYGADSSAIYSTLVRPELSTKQGDMAPRSIKPLYEHYRSLFSVWNFKQSRTEVTIMG